jgi:nucleoside-diphosphate-sugar epimerase
VTEKIAITGSKGYVGKFLVDALRNNGFEVIEGNRKNADVNDVIKLEKLIKNSDVVIHLAVYQNVFDKSYDNFEKVNVEGTKNLLELCKKYNKRVILFSSEVVFRKSNDFYTKSKKEQLALAKKYKNVEIIYPPVILDLKQKIAWWKLMPGGIMASMGDGGKKINFAEVRDLCGHVVEILKNNKSKLPIKTMTRSEFSTYVHERIGGFKVPFRIPVGFIKLAYVFFGKTKYGILLKSIIDNEK